MVIHNPYLYMYVYIYKCAILLAVDLITMFSPWYYPQQRYLGFISATSCYKPQKLRRKRSAASVGSVKSSQRHWIGLMMNVMDTGMKWYEMIWNDMKWYEMIWNDMKWYEVIWNVMKWYEMIWSDMKCYEMIWRIMKWWICRPNMLVPCTVFVSHRFWDSDSWYKLVQPLRGSWFQAPMDGQWGSVPWWKHQRPGKWYSRRKYQENHIGNPSSLLERISWQHMYSRCTQIESRGYYKQLDRNILRCGTAGVLMEAGFTQLLDDGRNTPGPGPIRHLEISVSPY